jgi:hypothetical protein
VPGWTAQLNMVHLAKPVPMTKDTITDAVGSIVWTAQPGAEIAPGQFQEFTISVEGLPTNTTTMVMPAVQTYSNGVVVNWNQNTVAGQPEPDHPAPHLALASANGAAAAPAASSATSGTSGAAALWLGGIGVLLGVVALGFAVGAFMRSNGKPRPAVSGPDNTNTDSGGREAETEASV